MSGTCHRAIMRHRWSWRLRCMAILRRLRSTTLVPHTEVSGHKGWIAGPDHHPFRVDRTGCPTHRPAASTRNRTRCLSTACNDRSRSFGNGATPCPPPPGARHATRSRRRWTRWTAGRSRVAEKTDGRLAGQPVAQEGGADVVPPDQFDADGGAGRRAGLGQGADEVRRLGREPLQRGRLPRRAGRGRAPLRLSSRPARC